MSEVCRWMCEHNLLDGDVCLEECEDGSLRPSGCCGWVECHRYEYCGWGPHIDAPPPRNAQGQLVDMNHILDCVRQARDSLIAEGNDLLGDNCGLIVRRACRCIGNGAGLLYKTWGHNVCGHSEDVIIFPNGAMADVVVGCGEANPGVAWQNLCCEAESSQASSCTVEPTQGGFEAPWRYMPCPSAAEENCL